MPIYKVTDPTTNKTVKLTGDSPPTEQELENIFSTINKQQSQQPISQGEITTPETFRKQQIERTIAQRPDLYSQAVKSYQDILSKQYTPQGMINQIIPSAQGLQMAQAGMQSLGGVAQRGIATLTNPLLEMGKGQFGNIPKSIKQGITGERLGEMGDIYRQAGIPETISAGLGLVTEGGLMQVGAKLMGLSKSANNLLKLQTTYGKDIARGIIRHTTGLSDTAVTYGVNRGWRNILTKENLDPALPTRIANRVLSNLDNIAIKEYDEFGKVIDKVKIGNVKALDLNQIIENTLKQNGYIDDAYKPTMKLRGNVVNKIQDFIDNATKSGIKPDSNIPIDIVQNFKGILKNFVPEKYWIGKSRSLKGEQRLAKDLYNSLNELIIENIDETINKAYSQVKRSYRQFKNFEKFILDKFSKVVGQEVTPTAEKLVNLTNQDPTISSEAISQLRNLDSFLKIKGYNPITNKLLDWNVVKDFIVKPKVGGLFEKAGEAIKGTMRQGLKTGVPTAVGSRAGKVMNKINPYIIPPSILRLITGRNE